MQCEIKLYFKTGSQIHSYVTSKQTLNCLLKHALWKRFHWIFHSNTITEMYSCYFFLKKRCSIVLQRNVTHSCQQNIVGFCLHPSFFSPSFPPCFSYICVLSAISLSLSTNPHPRLSSQRQLMLVCQQYSYFSGASCCSYRSVCVPCMRTCMSGCIYPLVYMRLLYVCVCL